MSKISIPRPIKFDIDAYETRSTGDKRNQTILLNTLSTFFPAGERFFISAVRHASRCLSREATARSSLYEDVSRFCGQEAHHARAHDEVNTKLYKDGYRNVESIVNFCLGRVVGRFPRLALHVTAVLEHWTATLARQVLDLTYEMERGQVFIWWAHAEEEWEHRAVSWDVLCASGGSKLISKLLFPLVSLVFITTIAVMYKLNGGKWDTALFKKLARNIPELCKYMKPGWRP